ncbi:protein DOG1-like 2 [Lolium rigidum]|uniref:protein DOG1-like 2 n=1 Tax=Lolium rigidum TaxID=89674 RepID=UPI001F5D7A5C|nr:protein DOG1-like 2 [Lolium rigidum]XP_051223081.1 protein DOG1-like 2 [Lolium perenne]
MTATSRPQLAAHANANGTLAPPTNGAETFAKFFECWILQQSRDLDALRAAAAAGPEDDAGLRRLVDRVLGHYEHYYRAKSAAASDDVLPMFAPSWISATETLYLWCGGWRPTAALQLLYSKSGAQLEAQLPAFLDGGDLHDGDLGGLSADQLQAADQLQRRTIRSEREIDEAAASAQESLATVKMVELSAGGGAAEEGMEREMDAKAEGMRRVLEMADGLRMDTLRAVVALLRPPQAVHFLVAAAELHLSVHDFGRRKDEAK